jgi:hypothetical protein
MSDVVRRVAIAVLAISSSACGGGTGSSSATAPTFAIDAAMKSLITSGFSASLSSSGNQDGTAVSGSGSANAAPAVATTFENHPALDVASVTDVAPNAASPTHYTSLVHQYFNPRYEPLGQLDPDGSYHVVTSFAGWPTAAKVGDGGNLGGDVASIF